MFFCVSNEPDNRFPCAWSFNRLCINTDLGWSVHYDHDRVYLYKGYTDYFKLKDSFHLLDSDSDLPVGNFCVFSINRSNGQIELFHSKYRTFPIFINDNGGLENLNNKGQQIWADVRIIVEQSGEIITRKYQAIGAWKNLPSVDKSTALDLIDEILNNKFSNFLKHNDKPIKIFLSGGIDTTLLYSYLKKHTDNFEVLWNVHQDLDWFMLKNRDTIRSNWLSYRLQHIFNSECVVLSGRPGDEYFLRGNAILISMLLLHHDIDPLEWLDDPIRKTCLHWDFLTRPEHLEVIKTFKNEKLNLIKIAHRDGLNHTILDRNINDHQIWHYGNTLTWTPLHDLEITKIMLRLPFEDQIGQFMDSSIGMELIKRIDPSLLSIISKKKNTGDFMCNLVKLLPDHCQPRKIDLAQP